MANGQAAEVTYKIINEKKILQGDIVLSEVYDSILDMPDQSYGRMDKLWLDGKVPYTIHNKIPNSKAINDAITLFNKQTVTNFVKRTNEDIYVEFIENKDDADVSQSYVGIYKENQPQNIWVGRNCGKEVILHELGHCIGLYHEHSRTDRDNFVTIHKENIRDDCIQDFNIVDTGSIKTEYDYASIMHYGRKLFSENGLDTIVPKNNAVIGKWKEMTHLDCYGISCLYPDLPEAMYKVTIKTADEYLAGTDSNIYLTICGKNNHTSVETTAVKLNSFINGNAFEQGKADIVYFKENNIKDINKIKIKSDRTWANPDWKIESITVEHTDMQAEFTINTWINSDNDYSFYTKEAVTSYHFEVKTANKTNAGTDSNINMSLVDEDDTETQMLIVNPYITKKDAFERNKTDTFNLNLLKIKKLKAIKIRTDMRYGSPAWYPEYVKVTPKGQESTTFTINEWIEDKEKTYIFSL